MAIGNLKTDAGLSKLNSLLQDNSYISGYLPSQADVQVLQELGGKAPDVQFPHVVRWYNHIKSFNAAELKAFPAATANPLQTATTTCSAPAKAADDDDVDLFASDDEDDAEAEKIRQERLKAYADKKSKKPALIAKSSIVLDVKPWDDETDMKEMEKSVRSIVMDGLVWGAAKLVPVGYGINKLQIICVVEDEKVSVDLLQEEIQNFEDYVQSVDVAAFNKI